MRIAPRLVQMRLAGLVREHQWVVVGQLALAAAGEAKRALVGVIDARDSAVTPRGREAEIDVERRVECRSAVERRGHTEVDAAVCAGVGVGVGLGVGVTATIGVACVLAVLVPLELGPHPATTRHALAVTSLMGNLCIPRPSRTN